MTATKLKMTVNLTREDTHQIVVIAEEEAEEEVVVEEEVVLEVGKIRILKITDILTSAITN